ncbi:unnamed protein product [Closterium sp. NIES-53]
MMCTRPDLAYPLNVLSRFVGLGHHTDVHWAAAKRILRYLHATSDLALTLGGSSPPILSGSSDSSYADSRPDCRSSQVYGFTLDIGLINWRSTRSSFVCLFTCEAELYAGTLAAQEARWLSFLLAELGHSQPSVTLSCDTASMIHLTENPAYHARSKHIEVRYFFVRELVQSSFLCLHKVAATANLADIFTKALLRAPHRFYVRALGLTRFAASGAMDLSPILTARPGAGGAGAGGAGAEGAGAGGAGAGGTGVGGAGAGGACAVGARAGGTHAGGAGAGGAGAGGSGVAGGAGASGARAGGTGAGGAGAGVTSAGDVEAVGTGPGGTRGAGAGCTAQRRPFFVLPPPWSLPPPGSLLHQVLSLPSSTGLTPPLLCPPPDQSKPQLQPDSPLPAPPYTEQTDSLTEHREPESRLALPICVVRTGRHVPRPRPPPVPGTHTIALCPSSVPLQVHLPSPLASTLLDVPDPESYLVRAAIPTLVDFAATCRLDFATLLAPESVSDCPPSVRGECTLGTDVLEDRVTCTRDTPALTWILQRFSFRFSLPQSTPLPTGHSLSAPPSDESVEPSGPYPEHVGCLITLGMGLVLGGRGPVVLTGHADASWSTRLSSVSSSSCEAVIYAGAMAAQELRWLTYLLINLGERPRSALVLFEARSETSFNKASTCNSTANNTFTLFAFSEHNTDFVSAALTIAGGYAGSGMGTGGVRWRSAISGAGGGGDDGSETDGQGGELPPAAVAVEGEASGGDVAEAVDASPSAAIAPYLAAVQGVGEGRQRRRRQYGTYGDDIEEEAEGFEEPADEAEYRHLYDARGVVDKWLGDPALWGMLSADALGGDGEEEEDEGEGPELRWETRMVLGPGGDAWHPANRKVKVSVFVRELQLSRLARERLLALVGRRYNTHRDELTIVSERYRHREENRKDVFRILHALIAEAKQADHLAAQAAAEAAPITRSQAASLA